MLPTKKVIESHYFERFRRFLNSFPGGEVVPSEEPDFLIVSPGRTIGIELTELHRSASTGATPQQASEAMRHRVVARAQEIYQCGNYPPIRCAVHFQEGHIQRKQVEGLASAIAKLAIRNLPEPNASTREEYEWTNRDYFPEELNAVGIHRLDEITRTHFFCPGATWVAPLHIEDIQRSLTAKEAKYNAYRTRCAEAWLLINTDIEAMSTWFQFESEPLAHTFESRFERVFILRHFGGELHELHVVAPRVA